MTKAKPLPDWATLDYLKQIMNYNSVTGRFKYVDHRPRNHFTSGTGYSVWHRKCAGKDADNIQVCKSRGYYHRREFRLKGHRFLCHKVAWYFMTGIYPLFDIDHINGDSTDNRWENLRDGSKVNMHNMKIFKNNTSGFNGVSFDKSKGKYVAYYNCPVEGKPKKIGHYDCPLEAGEASRCKRNELGYTGRHGT